MRHRFASSMLIAASAALWAAPAWSKLPPPTPEAQAKAAEAKLKSDHAAKVASYQLCLYQDKAAANHQSVMRAAGKEVKPAVATAPCTDPGPFKPPEAQAAAPAK